MTKRKIKCEHNEPINECVQHIFEFQRETDGLPTKMSVTQDKLDDEIRQIVGRSIETGKKIERAKGLTTNQGGIPNPEFYEQQMVSSYVRKLTALVKDKEGLQDEQNR